MHYLMCVALYPMMDHWVRPSGLVWNGVPFAIGSDRIGYVVWGIYTYRSVGQSFILVDMRGGQGKRDRD